MLMNLAWWKSSKHQHAPCKLLRLIVTLGRDFGCFFFGGGVPFDAFVLPCPLKLFGWSQWSDKFRNAVCGYTGVAPFDGSEVSRIWRPDVVKPRGLTNNMFHPLTNAILQMWISGWIISHQSGKAWKEKVSLFKTPLKVTFLSWKGIPVYSLIN